MQKLTQAIRGSLLRGDVETITYHPSLRAVSRAPPITKDGTYAASRFVGL